MISSKYKVTLTIYNNITLYSMYVKYNIYTTE